MNISVSSAQNFAHYSGNMGNVLVSIKCDGTKSPFIPPTPDIDGDLKASIMHFLDQTTVTPGKPCHGKTYVIHFDVTNGSVTEDELPPPPG
ncbi:MAG TPA: hypothetical protein VGF86_06405 [Candidatus Tumulicola sp.]|jgi:hypothetical protein